jgi:hypothetical protein
MKLQIIYTLSIGVYGDEIGHSHTIRAKDDFQAIERSERISKNTPDFTSSGWYTLRSGGRLVSWKN